MRSKTQHPLIFILIDSIGGKIAVYRGVEKCRSNRLTGTIEREHISSVLSMRSKFFSSEKKSIHLITRLIRNGKSYLRGDKFVQSYRSHLDRRECSGLATVWAQEVIMRTTRVWQYECGIYFLQKFGRDISSSHECSARATSPAWNDRRHRIFDIK